MLSPDDTLTAVENSAVFVEIPRGIFLLRGHDATRYLQGRLTQDIKALQPSEAAYSLLLTPQGRTLGQLLVAHLGDGYLALSDPLGTPEERSELLRSLLLFKVADDVQSVDLSDEYVSIALIGATSLTIAQRVLPLTFKPTAPPKLPLVDAELRYLVHAPLGDYECVEIVMLRSQLGEVLSLFKAEGIAPIGADAYEALRITAGIPRMGAEITEKTIGADLPLERTVAFRKGCYAGQEVIEMATARGRPNRRLITLRVPGSVAAGSDVILDDEGELRSIGSVTSSIFLPGREESRALAFIKYTTPDSSALTVADAPVISYRSGL